jgi:hypothetical protein
MKGSSEPKTANATDFSRKKWMAKNVLVATKMVERKKTYLIDVIPL